ncbi:sigma-70 family RNA polymerase sigma factor [Kribbella sp. NBC_00709]|uniref:RNA polymerase sigma factor n=1 Tax=Kribbella sp. NBC_00709 TaxID=2975972 RepID=UPI002E2B03F5|nr:sigma-70 family RNA polymerase sigma factor [Kribbella sp. NBC_00709]
MEEDVSPVTALVVTAAAGDQQAWRALVDRYAPLLVSVVRGFRLTPAETEDVAQTVWLRLVEHLDSLQEPRAIPGWLVTTARRESIRYLSSQRYRRTSDPLNEDQLPLAADGPDPDEGLVRSERHQVLLAGLAELPSRQRELLLLLMHDPQPSYAEIKRRTGIPVGSIGPTRARALERLRRTPAVREYVASELPGGDRHDAASLG